jgi:tetratricopeptide (TPR) repeat protein
MWASEPKEVELGWELLKEGAENPKQRLSKNKEALQLIIDFEKSEGITPEEYLSCQNLKAYIMFSLGETEEAIKLLEKNYQECVKAKKYLWALDNLYGFTTASYWSGRPLSWKDIETMENLLKSASNELPSEIELRRAQIYHSKGSFYLFKGNYDLTLEHWEKSLEICDRLNYRYYLYHLKNVINGYLGTIYEFKGELGLALKHLEQLRKRYKDSELWGDKLLYIDSLRDIGIIYYQQGDSDNAITYFEKNLKENRNQIERPFITSLPFYFLIKSLVDKNSLEQAKEYLERFNHYNERLKNKQYNIWYKLTEAIVLKASTQTRDRAEAEKILTNLIESHEIKSTGGWGDFATQYVGFELCDIYLEKLRTTNDLEILDEINPLITTLLEWSERTNSFIVQAKITLLQSQIALLEMNMGEARRYLTQAQKMAETHGLHLLARKISYEHDKLLEQLKDWESLKKQKAPISDRINLVLPEETIDLILKKRSVKPPEVLVEEPVLFAIMSKTGYLALINPFSIEIPFDENRIGEFVSFFNSISGQMFSKSLDRAKFGEYTLLLKNLDSISFCYLFEGQSYLAQLRLNNFFKTVQKNAGIMDVIKSAIQIGQTITLDDSPELEALVAEIFLSEPHEIGVSTEPDDSRKLIKKSRRIRKQATTQKKKIKKIIIAEIEIEVAAILLFIISHLLFLAPTEKVNFPLLGAVEPRVMVELTLYLGIGCLLIVLTVMIFNWLKETLKNKFVTAEIMLQILALLLILTAHIFYLGLVERPKHEQILKQGVYTIVIDSALFPGIGCMLLVIILILLDYMKRH